MAYDAGIKVGVEGNSEFKRAIREINDELKTMDSALRLVESSYQGQMNSMEALQAKGEALQAIYDKQSEKVKELANALQNARNSESQYAEKVGDIKSKLAAAQAEMERLKNTTGDTTDEQKRLASEIDKLTKELKSAEQGQSAATRAVNDWQRQLNDATVKLNNLEGELKDNKRYMAEAEKSADKCATSIDKYGKATKEASEATEDATDKSTMLKEIFAGGLLANIASQALSALTSKLKQLATEAFKLADELKKMSAETRLTTDTLQEWQYIGASTGVSLDVITSSLKRLINNMDTARTGTGEANEAFEALGVKIRNDVTGELLDSTVVFEQVIDALSRMKNETERDALAQDLLGKSATELNPLIEEGSANLREMAQAAHEAGAVMSEDTIDALDEAGDRLEKWWQTLKARVGEAIVAIGTFLTGNSAATGESVDSLDSLKDKIDEVNATYDSVRLAAQKSIETQMGLWEDMSGAAKKSLGDIKLAVASQMQWLMDYSTNLANLSMRNVAGVDKLVAKLSDGTTESAAVLAGLATASDDELRRLIAQMAEVDARQEGLARQFAQFKTNATGQINDLYAGVRDSANQLNAYKVAEQAGYNTMQGYINAVSDMTDDIEDAFRKAARAGNEAYKDELKIRSPSKVAMETTENYFEGHILKALQMIPKMEEAYAEPAKRAHLAMQSAIPLVVEQPAADAGAQAAIIGDSISKALSGSAAGVSGRPIHLTVNLISELDGRQLAKATREYLIEENELAGQNLIE